MAFYKEVHHFERLRKLTQAMALDGSSFELRMERNAKEEIQLFLAKKETKGRPFSPHFTADDALLGWWSENKTKVLGA